MHLNLRPVTGAAPLLFLATALHLGCQKPATQKVSLPETSTSSAAQAAPAAASPTPNRTAAPAKKAERKPTVDVLAAGNFDGQGDDEVVAWINHRLALFQAKDGTLQEVYTLPAPEEANLQGAPRLFRVANLDGDGRPDLLMAFGQSREAPNARIQLAALRIKDGPTGPQRVLTILFETSSPRPEAVGLEVANLEGDRQPELLLAYYDDKYTVTAQILSLKPGAAALDGPLTGHALESIRMAASWSAGDINRDGVAELFVGRPYGEEKLSPGDLFQLQDGKRLTIPTRLGIRSLLVGELTGGGTPEVIFGDGWHYDYGKVARGRLSYARLEGKDWKTSLIQDTPGQYEIAQLQLVDLNGDRKPELLAAGNLYTQLYWQEGTRWKVRKLAETSHFTVANQGGEPWLITGGETLGRVSLKDATRDGSFVEAASSTPPSNTSP